MPNKALLPKKTERAAPNLDRWILELLSSGIALDAGQCYPAARETMLLDQLPFSPQLVHARWIFDLLPSEKLPSLAQDALEIGYDGKYTRRIAGMIQPDTFDLQPLMAGFFTELGIEGKLTQEQAGHVLAHLIAQEIVQGRVRPYEGARFIGYEVAITLWGNDLRREFVPFIGLASEYEDCEFYSQNSEACAFLSQKPAEARRELEQHIIEAARNFVKQSQ